MSFFDKLKKSLTGTREAIKSGIDNVFAAFRSVDEDLYEELEEALILADVGAEEVEIEDEDNESIDDILDDLE